MGWYQEGTLSVTQNSTSVTGASTRWVSNVRVGEALLAPDGRFYEVTSISSDGAMSIAPAYKGATAAGQAYAIVPIQGYVKRLADQAARVLNGITLDLSDKADKSELPTAVRSALLDGIVFNVTSAVVAGDSVLRALGKLQAQASNKVDKVAGKVLSSNDFTNTERVKLTNIAEQATKNASDADLRDRSTHTGTQAISTVSGLQAALDSKETPAGALAQMQSAGLKTGTLQSIEDLDAWRTSGTYKVTGAVALSAGLPASLDFVIEHIAGGTLNSGVRQFAMPITSSAAYIGRVYQRVNWGGNWQPWKEFALTESPAFSGTPSAPSLKLGNAASSDANTLDHYEEGTFTPTLQGVTTAGVNTYSNNRGFYTRIGDTVFWSAQFQLTSTSGMTGQLRMVGLPFNTFNNGGVRSAVNIGYYNALSDTAAYDLRAFHAANGAHVDFLKRSVGGTTTGSFPSTEITSNTQIYVSGHYKAA